MNKTITELLKHCNEDSTMMEELIERFKPLITSYAKRCGWKIETEDFQSILTIKLIELAKSMNVYENEAQNVKFIANSLRNHFLDVVRKINRLDRIELVTLDSIQESGALDKEDVTFYDMIKGLDTRKQEIICLKFRDMLTDKEIADKLGVSRQAINKQLRIIYKLLTNIAQ